jgi:hypothetical protein
VAFAELATAAFSSIATTYMTDHLLFSSTENGIAILLLHIFGIHKIFILNIFRFNHADVTCSGMFSRKIGVSVGNEGVQDYFRKHAPPAGFSSGMPSNNNCSSSEQLTPARTTSIL